MLWHGIGGCCWHHSHDVCTALQAAEGHGVCECGHRHAESVHAGAKHFHGTSATHDDSESPWHGDHDCGEGNCVYVKTSSPDVVDLAGLPLPVVYSIADCSHCGETYLRRLTERETEAPAPSSLERCALTQSWLL